MRLRWSVALLTVLTMSIVQAQMPTMTSIQAGGGPIVITALGHGSVQVEQGNKVVIVDPVACDGRSVTRQAGRPYPRHRHPSGSSRCGSCGEASQARRTGRGASLSRRDEADPGRHGDAEPHDADQRAGARRHHRDLRTCVQHPTRPQAR